MSAHPLRKQKSNDKMRGESAASGVRPAPCIANLFPEGVVAFECDSVGTTEQLFDTERFCVEHSVKSRVQEFASGRACARAALAQLGLPVMPIPSGPDRAPIWPQGFVGSISHASGHCVAVAGRMKQRTCGHVLTSLGVDIEQLGVVTPDLWPQLMHRREMERLQSLSEVERTLTATVVFSAKEAFYKAQFPITRSWIDFDDVVVEVCAQTYVVHINNTDLPIARWAQTFEGRFLVEPTHVVTAMAI
jgi:4'-phosphopantetheinyl transferase EntD